MAVPLHLGEIPHSPEEGIGNTRSAPAAQCNLHRRIILDAYPGTLKLVHLLPSVFTAGLAFLLLVTLAGLAAGCLHALWALTPPLLFALLVLVDATRAERSLSVGVRAVAASFVQLCGYGSGFLRAWWRQCVRGKSEFEAEQVVAADVYSQRLGSDCV